MPGPRGVSSARPYATGSGVSHRRCPNSAGGPGRHAQADELPPLPGSPKPVWAERRVSLRLQNRRSSADAKAAAEPADGVVSAGSSPRQWAPTPPGAYRRIGSSLASSCGGRPSPPVPSRRPLGALAERLSVPDASSTPVPQSRQVVVVAVGSESPSPGDSLRHSMTHTGTESAAADPSDAAPRAARVRLRTRRLLTCGEDTVEGRLRAFSFGSSVDGFGSTSRVPFSPKSGVPSARGSEVIHASTCEDDAANLEALLTGTFHSQPLHSSRVSSSRQDCGTLLALATGADETLYTLRYGAVEKCRVDILPGVAPLRAPVPDPSRADVFCARPGASVPYLSWEHTTTHADRRERPLIRLSDDGVTAEPAHLSTQGTVIGGVAFSEGIHQWRANVSDIGGVSFGIVSRVGVDSFTACRRGELPPYVACLRPGWRLEHRLHWRDGTGQEHWCEVDPPLARHFRDAENEMSVVVDFFHKLITFLVNDVVVACVDCARRTAAATPAAIESLLDAGRSAADTNSRASFGSVLSAVVPRPPAPELAPASGGAALLGDHTVFCHVQYGARATLRWKTVRNFHAMSYADVDAQRAEPPRLICGNPYARWSHFDGVGVEATFRLPMGMCHWKGRLWVTDCGTIREISLPDGTVTTHTVQLYPHDSQPPIEYLGAIHAYAPRGGGEDRFYVSDLTNGTLLQVSPTTWQARQVFNHGHYGFRPCGSDRRKRLSRLIGEMRVYDVAAATCSSSVVGLVARSCETTWRGMSSLDLPPHTFGVHGLTNLPVGLFFIADSDRHCIFCVDLHAPHPQCNTPEICCGVPSSPGCTTGLGEDARFRNPTRIVVDADSDVLYVADTGNWRTCKVTLHWGGSRGRYTAQVEEICHVEAEETTSFVPPEETEVRVQPFGLALQSSSLLVSDPRGDIVWQVSLREGIRGAGASFLAPVEQLMGLIRQAQRQADAMPVKNAEHIKTLERAYEIISTTPNIYEMQYVGGAMDHDVARYLTEEYAPSKGVNLVVTSDAEEEEEEEEEEMPPIGSKRSAKPPATQPPAKAARKATPPPQPKSIPVPPMKKGQKQQQKQQPPQQQKKGGFGGGFGGAKGKKK
eukprot:TRINITY_DN1690_c2_g1_i1.p1 TRINITY_DN1690_c2_g1~~TRINITY_DN1690_c2_g1_i1.p1  ORF type:complete len:1094 (+),score=287.45 TRINITY_DN1690_c2_g1_i1:84-3365(+)